MKVNGEASSRPMLAPVEYSRDVEREQELVKIYGPEIVSRTRQVGPKPRTDQREARRDAERGIGESTELAQVPKGKDWMDTVTDAVAIVDSDDVERRQTVQRWVRRLAWMLDESIEIPVIGRRIGLDGIVGLIPVVGDSATLMASVSVIVSGIATGASLPTITRMVLNTMLDSVVGAVPIAGQVWDFVYKSNTRNIRLLEADLADREATKRSSMKILMIAAIAVFVVVAAFVVALVYLIQLLF